MNILWATDGSPASSAALPWLKGPLNQRGNRVTIVTAVPSPILAEGRPDPSMLLWNLVPNYRERVSQAATDLVVREVEAIGASKAEVTSQILVGSPPVALLNELNANPPDLLVMGAHGHGGVRDFLVGSVTRQVAMNAPCSTLVVRAKRRPKVVLVAYDGSPDADAAIDLLAALPATGMSATVLSVAEPPSVLYAAIDPSSTVKSAQAQQRARARTLILDSARLAALQTAPVPWVTGRRVLSFSGSDDEALTWVTEAATKRGFDGNVALLQSPVDVHTFSLARLSDEELSRELKSRFSRQESLLMQLVAFVLVGAGAVFVLLTWSFRDYLRILRWRR